MIREPFIYAAVMIVIALVIVIAIWFAFNPIWQTPP